MGAVPVEDVKGAVAAASAARRWPVLRRALIH